MWTATETVIKETPFLFSRTQLLHCRLLCCILSSAGSMEVKFLTSTQYFLLALPFSLHFSPAPVWILSFGLQSFREKIVRQVFQEISICSSVGSPTTMLHAGFLVSYRECLIWCCEALYLLTLVFPLLFFTSSHCHALTVQCFLHFLHVFIKGPQTSWSQLSAYSWTVLEPAVKGYVLHSAAPDFFPQRPLLQPTPACRNMAT